MPKELPAVPNLEHLKKQAKGLLREYQAGKADAAERLRPQIAAEAPNAVKLADAQCAIAREYGFASWRRLKEHVDAITLEKGDPMEEFKQAICKGDAQRVTALVERHPQLKASINLPILGFDQPPILVAVQSKNRELVEVLLRLGADINARSQWWAGGFGVLDWAQSKLAALLIERGATVDVHAAARLGMTARLRELVEANPELVHARGGDGKTPLHCASTVEVAEYLLARGAEIDARDIDHESTAAQYLLEEHQDVVRYLVQRGCATDTLMAAALGDFELAERLLRLDPESIRMRVSDEWFPMVRPKGGGTIYQWVMGWYVSAHQVAKKYGHDDFFEWLMERTPSGEKFLVACWLHDEALAQQLLRTDGGLVARLTPGGKRQAAHAARNNDPVAVRMMLAAGLPVEARSQHGATPLHWAAHHGNFEMLTNILGYSPPLDARDEDFGGMPLDWAIHGSREAEEERIPVYVEIVRALIEAGAKGPETAGAPAEILTELRRYGSSSS